MDKGTRGLAMMLAMQFQAIIFLAAGWYGAEWLDEHYPLGHSWLVYSMPLSLVLIAHSFYVVIRFLVMKDKAEKKKRNNDK